MNSTNNAVVTDLMNPSEDAVIAMMEASVLGRPSLDDETYVLSIWRAGINAMKGFKHGN